MFGYRKRRKTERGLLQEIQHAPARAYVIVLLHSNKRKHFHAACLSRVHVSLRFRMSTARTVASDCGSCETSAKQSLSTAFLNRAYPLCWFAGFILQMYAADRCHLCDACLATRAKRPRRHEQLCRCQAGSNVTCRVSRLHGDVKPLARTRQLLFVSCRELSSWRLYLDRLV